MFAAYLFVVGPMLVVAPNFLLSIFRIPSTSEVWIHVVGVRVFALGVHAWVAAKHGNQSFLEASVYTRCLVFVAFPVFVVTGLAKPMGALFGVAELLGATWTYIALKADAQALKPTVADGHCT